MELDILTISEYIESMKAYYINQENLGEVVQCVSPQGYEFWTKCKTLEEIGKLWYKHEPILKRDFNSEDEVILQMKKTNPSDIIGCNFRWLPGNRACRDVVVLQPRPIRNISEVDKLCEIKRKDRIFGILMDPFTYTGPTDEEKDLANENNYRVFTKKISTEEYLKLEDLYYNSLDRVYSDEYFTVKYGSSSLTNEFREFLKINCPTCVD